MGRRVGGVSCSWECVEGTPSWNTYQEKYMWPTLVGEPGGGVRGVGPSRGIRRVRLEYLSWSTGMSWRMLSHTCDNWYFPRFLFGKGSFTWMNMASLMFLELPCVSLCMMLTHSGLSGWPFELLCWWMGDGALRHFLILSPSALPDPPIYSSGQFMWGHLKW